MAALCTRASTPSPNSAAASIRAAAPPIVPTSARTAQAFAPLAFSRATATAAAASSNPYPSTTGRPERASRSAIASPMPLVPPVTMVVICAPPLLRDRLVEHQLAHEPAGRGAVGQHLVVVGLQVERSGGLLLRQRARLLVLRI